MAATTAVLAAQAAVLAAPAPPLPTLRVLVRVTSSQDWAQSTRIRGQISDLDVELAEVPSAVLEPARPEQIDAAAILARQLRGDLVIWLQGADVLMFVAAPAPGYLLVRPVVFQPPTAGASGAADLEGTALGVRSVVRALREGTLIGAGTPYQPAAAAAPHLAACGAIAVAVGYDGIGFAPGTTMRLGLAYGRAEAGVFGAAFASHALEMTGSRADVSRTAFGLFVGAEVTRSQYLRTFVAATAGGSRLRLDTGDNGDPRDALRPQMGVAAEARVPLVSRSWLRVEALVGAALDLVLDPPSVVWRAGGGNGTASWALSSWEPHATIALRLVTGRDLP